MWALIVTACFTNGTFSMCVNPEIVHLPSEAVCEATATNVRRRFNEELLNNDLTGTFTYICAEPI